MSCWPCWSGVNHRFAKSKAIADGAIDINIKNNSVKVSARANEKLAERLNLADVMRMAAEKVGGRGGGHRVAAGANISPDKVEEFLKEVDRLCCAMLA